MKSCHDFGRIKLIWEAAVQCPFLKRGVIFPTMEAGAQELRGGISATAHIFQNGVQVKTEGVEKTAVQG
jgi:hypothetical protein